MPINFVRGHCISMQSLTQDEERRDYLLDLDNVRQLISDNRSNQMSEALLRRIGLGTAEHLHKVPIMQLIREIT
jgi:hypothetical protein